MSSEIKRRIIRKTFVPEGLKQYLRRHNLKIPDNLGLTYETVWSRIKRINSAFKKAETNRVFKGEWKHIKTEKNVRFAIDKIRKGIKIKAKRTVSRKAKKRRFAEYLRRNGIKIPEYVKTDYDVLWAKILKINGTFKKHGINRKFMGEWAWIRQPERFDNVLAKEIKLKDRALELEKTESQKQRI